MGSEKKKRKREDKEEKKKHKKRKHGKEKKSKKEKKHKKEKRHKGEDGTVNPGELKLQQGGSCSVSSKCLSSLVSHHPNGAKQVFLIAKALQDGQGVALDLLPSPLLRQRVAALLDSVTYTPPPPPSKKSSKRAKEIKAPALMADLQGMSLSTTYRLLPPHESSPLPHPLLQALLRAVDKLLGPLPDVSCAQSAVDRLLCAFPVLEGELPSLLARIAQGERVDVSGLEDEKLKRGLVKVFEALGFVFAAEGEGEEAGYGLVKGEGRRAQRAQVKEVLWRNGGQALIGDIIDDDQEDAQLAAAAAQAKAEAEAKAAAAAAAVGGEGAVVGGEGLPVRKGPAMPDAATLALAQEQAAAMMDTLMAGEGVGSEEEESDDDMVGPSLGDNRRAVPDHIAFKHLAPKEEGGREEWMTMGPGKAMGSLAALQPSMQGRQFQQRSTRAKNAAPSVDKKVLTPQQMAELRQDAAKASKRKTLLEQHQEKAAKGQGAAKEESLARKAWNREEFMEGRKTLDAREAQKLFVAAKELGTRFSRTFR